MQYPKQKQGSGPRPSGTPKRVAQKISQSKKQVPSTGMHQPTSKVR